MPQGPSFAAIAEGDRTALATAIHISSQFVSEQIATYPAASDALLAIEAAQHLLVTVLPATDTVASNLPANAIPSLLDRIATGLDVLYWSAPAEHRDRIRDARACIVEAIGDLRRGSR